ncbi:MAG: hypothetical protein FWC16_01665 [Defluviitaleaceae bacterium]|nr:hypothetical protein [Defluviitaleaceae bacterium]MCL2273608.1 hypothetical protein [Defluviitaleaceae bacterium]
MKFYTEKTVVSKQLADVRCNACGREVGRNACGYMQDYVSLSKEWGYHSPFDGEAHSIDLCVDCYQSWINAFEIPPERLNEEYACA